MVLDLVLIGLAIAVNPSSVTAFVLVLSTRGGISNGLAFVLTWLASFVAIIAVVLLMTGGKPRRPSRRPPRSPGRQTGHRRGPRLVRGAHPPQEGQAAQVVPG